MGNLAFITTRRFVEVLAEEAERIRASGLSFIKNPTGFVNHLVGTGKKAEEVTRRILTKHNSLDGCINPDLARVAGFMHDYGKLAIGDPYHEIEGAYAIMNDKELELVAGGSDSERRTALKRIARCLTGDAFIYEELGENFPETALYPAFATDRVVEQLAFLRRELGNGEPLSVAEFSSPSKLEHSITIYSDFSNLDGQKVDLQARLADINTRYNEYARTVSPAEVEKYRKIAPTVTIGDVSEYYAATPRILTQIAPRLLTAFGHVEELM